MELRCKIISHVLRSVKQEISAEAKDLQSMCTSLDQMNEFVNKNDINKLYSQRHIIIKTIIESLGDVDLITKLRTAEQLLFIASVSDLLYIYICIYKHIILHLYEHLNL